MLMNEKDYCKKCGRELETTVIGQYSNDGDYEYSEEIYCPFCDLVWVTE